jgi:hypothetical protein
MPAPLPPSIAGGHY